MCVLRENIVRKIIFALSCVYLSGCATQPPLQIGNDKYRILRPDVMSQQAVQEAQIFCRNKNFDYAEVSADYDGSTVFFCMKRGEKLSYKDAK